MVTIRDPAEKKIISLLRKKPLQTIDVASALGIERHTVVKYLESMESRGLISHEVKRRAKIWKVSRPNLISALRKNDPAVQQLSEILDNVDEHISIQDRKRVIIWKNKYAKHNALNCHQEQFKEHFNQPIGCKNCPVERTFITGKSDSREVCCSGKMRRIITKPIKDEKNKTIAVVEIIRENKGKKSNIRADGKNN
jgi:transcriptional regulator with PAS, ATPase and Fis domain